VPALIEAPPLLTRAGLKWSALTGAVLTAIGATAALGVPAYSADRQQRFAIQHVSDVTHGKSWWSVLNDSAPLPAALGGQWRRGELPFSDRPRWLTGAPSDPTARAPDLQLVSQIKNGEERTLTLRLAANGNEHVDLIAPPDSQIRSAGIDGFVRPIDQDEAGKFAISCFGRSCDGAVMRIVTTQDKPIEFIVLGGKVPLPASAAALLAARPRFARPQYNRDETMSFRMHRL